MPKTVDPVTGEIVYELGAGDVIIEVARRPGNFLQLSIALAPAGESHAPGDRCYDAFPQAEVVIVFPTPQALATFINCLGEGMMEVYSPK